MISPRESSPPNAEEECVFLFLRFFAILIMVILPVEMLLLSQGYTFSPYFFFVSVFALCKSSKPKNNNNVNDDGGRQKGAVELASNDRYPLPASARSHLRKAHSRNGHHLLPQEDNGAIEPFWTQDEESPPLQRVDENDIVVTASAIESDSDSSALPIAKAVPLLSGGDEKAKGVFDSKGKGLLPCSFSLLSTRQSKALPSEFISIVQDTRGRTTEVEVRKTSNSADPLVSNYPTNGVREIRYEMEGSDDSFFESLPLDESIEENSPGELQPPSSSTSLDMVLTAKSLVDFRFSRGFNGWNITGNGRRITPEDNNEDDEQEQHRSFFIGKGFLSKSGKIYWEERGVGYGILVAGDVSDTSLKDIEFSGYWMASTAYSVDVEERRLHRGKISGFTELSEECHSIV